MIRQSAKRMSVCKHRLERASFEQPKSPAIPQSRMTSKHTYVCDELLETVDTCIKKYESQEGLCRLAQYERESNTEVVK